MSFYEKIAERFESKSTVDRGRFLSKTAKWGVALFAGASSLVKATPAWAICRVVGCCELEYCRDCENPSSCASCHSQRWVWGCVDQSQHLWECIECYSGTCSGCSYARFGTSPSP